MTAAVALQGIEKRFGEAAVLRGVTLSVARGEVLGLVGENGAGKSTLMNVLGGHLRPDAGTMALHGSPYAPRDASDAQRAGVAFVHQELTLFDNLSVAENLGIVGFPRRWRLPIIDRRATALSGERLLARVGLRVPAATNVGRLTVGERQLVEIARAIGAEARVLILDEPTTSLGLADRQRLHALVDDLRRGGLSIIYISHELTDVRQVCDRIAVMRDGAVVASDVSSQLDDARLVKEMVGRDVRQLYPERPRTQAHPVALLEVDRLSMAGRVLDVSFTLHQGEILGLFGLLGAGRTELLRTIFGLEAASAGTITLDGAPLRGDPGARRRRRLALVTEERRSDGLCLEASIADNLALVCLHDFTRRPWGLLDQAAMAQAVAKTGQMMHLTGSADASLPVSRLSGGNQQKVVLGKWLMARPRVLMLDEPTRGIDVGARAEIYQVLRDRASTGAGLLIASSDMEELIGLCDRVLVMRAGSLAGEVNTTAGGADRQSPVDHTTIRERLLTLALPERVAVT